MHELQQQLAALRADHQVQTRSHQAALQAEVLARQTAEATANELQAQLTHLRKELAEAQDDFEVTELHVSGVILYLVASNPSRWLFVAIRLHE